MGLDVYFRRDIKCVLEAIWVATEGASQGDTGNGEYQRGVRNTIVSVGKGFGLVPVAPVEQGQSAPLLLTESPYEQR